MNRRDFLRISTTLSAYGLVSLGSGAGVRLVFAPRRADAAPPLPLLTHGKSTDHAGLVNKVLEPLGGMARFVKPGATVVVKPNIGWDRVPELAANTNPVVVRRVVELALAAGAAKVLVFDRPCNDPKRCYFNSGIKKAVEDIGDSRARIEFIDKRKFVKMAVARGGSLDTWEFYKPCLTADTFINVPIAKHHSSATLTMSLKNMMGPVGGRRGLLHLSLHQRIVDLNTVLRPHLHILDATRILIANGPQGGNPSDVRVPHKMAACTDPVALDSWGTSLFGLEPQDVEHIVLANRQGLGQIQLDKVRISSV